MPHFITDKCIGCSVCEIKCPTNTIWGESKGQYYIHPERCIDCSVCGIYCPVDAISMIDANDETLANHYKIAYVQQNKCVACRLCESVCDKDAIIVPDAPTQLKTYLPDFVVMGTGR